MATADVKVVLVKNIDGALVISTLKNWSRIGIPIVDMPPAAEGKFSAYILLMGINLSYPSTFKIAS